LVAKAHIFALRSKHHRFCARGTISLAAYTTGFTNSCSGQIYVGAGGGARTRTIKALIDIHTAHTAVASEPLRAGPAHKPSRSVRAFGQRVTASIVVLTLINIHALKDTEGAFDSLDLVARFARAVVVTN